MRWEDEFVRAHPKTTGTLIFVLGMAVGTVAFLSWASTKVPAESELIVVSGSILYAKPATPKSKDFLFRVQGHEPEFRYVDWYPNHALLRRELTVGASVAIRTKPGGDDVWGVEVDGKTVVAYEQLERARSRNATLALCFAVGSPLFVLYGLFDIHLKTRRPTGR